MSSLHRQLDAMDRKLDNMEDEVKGDTWTNERNGNNVAAKSRQQILQEQRDMVSDSKNWLHAWKEVVFHSCSIQAANKPTLYCSEFVCGLKVCKRCSLSAFVALELYL